MYCMPSDQGRSAYKKALTELPHPSQRFTTVHMDIVGPLSPSTSSQGIITPRYLLTMVDSYSRWLEACPICNIDAETVSKAFISTWISRFGPPLTLVTDRGAQFRAELMTRMTDILGIHHIRTSAYNPKANGKIERIHRSLKASLKARGGYWLEQLPTVLFGLRISPDDEGRSAFSVLTGEQPLIPPVVTNYDHHTLKEFSTQMHNLFFPYRMPKQNRIKPSYIPKALEKVLE